MTVTSRRKKTGKGTSASSSAAICYHCNYCRKDITDVVRIRCAVCPDFDLCVECFSVGVELSPHKNDHSYRVLSKLDFPIFTIDWGADEELLLLEAIDIYGLGNWADISDHIGTKSRTECEQHYLNVYMNSAACPLPDMSVHFNKEEIENYRKKRKEIEQALKENMGRKTTEEFKSAQSHPANHEIAGFMPLRKDFETEFDNEVEELVKDMTFSEDESPADIELKLAILEIYNSKLDARVERKRFIFDRDLIDFKKQQSIERKRTKEEREIYNQYKVFSQFMTKQDFDTFVDGLIFEQKVRNRINQLQEYRLLGIKTLAGGDIYEVDKRKRETELSLRKSKETSSYLYADRPAMTPRHGRVREREEPPISTSAMSLPAKGPRKAVTPLDIANAESVELLSIRERELCTQLRILPKAYVSIKETLIKEYNRLGHLRRNHARQLVRIDVNKTGRIYDFLVSSGWVKSSSV